MRPENKRMAAYLKADGIVVMPKRILDGSMRGCWRLYNHDEQWTEELRAKLTALGFVDFDGAPLGPYAGNGGRFSVFVRGHDEMMEDR